MAPKLREPPAVLSGPQSCAQGCPAPGWPAEPQLAAVQCLLWAVAMPHSGILAGEVQGQVCLSPMTPSLVWPPGHTFSTYSLGSNPGCWVFVVYSPDSWHHPTMVSIAGPLGRSCAVGAVPCVPGDIPLSCPWGPPSWEARRHPCSTCPLSLLCPALSLGSLSAAA
jgi:hypothetical protein